MASERDPVSVEVGPNVDPQIGDMGSDVSTSFDGDQLGDPSNMALVV